VPSDLVDKVSRAIDFGVSLEVYGGQSAHEVRKWSQSGLYRPNKGQRIRQGDCRETR
jgi:hypothetical protein